jgi:acyl-CoA reductase-like NAD-dependent aldehyde dehydrogenase
MWHARPVKTLVSLNPATGEPIGEVPVTPVAEIPAAVARARAAQPAWEELGVEGRADLWLEIGRRIGERTDDIAELVTREMGKPLAEAAGEVKSCGEDVARDLEEIARALAPETSRDGSTESVVYHDPFGVCAVVSPWNFPFAMPHWMVFPALATGNTAILKPSEETPLVGQLYADLLNEVLPPGVLQVVQGADDQGSALVAAAGIDLIAFTGSREVGKKIMTAAASDLKRLVLELGGKDPLVVLADADLARAARFAARNSFRNAGQVCVSTERILVDRSVAGEFVDRLVAETAGMKSGDGFDGETRVGPMINARHRDRVLRQIDDAVARGAKVVHGGAEHTGNFIAPTVLIDVTDDMEIAREETFGPVACVSTVDGEKEAIERANDTRFGLGAVVFGGEESAARVARKLSAGMIGINKSVGGAAGTPWVGARESGFGFHSSVAGHRQFTQTRVVSRSR